MKPSRDHHYCLDCPHALPSALPSEHTLYVADAIVQQGLEWSEHAYQYRFEIQDDGRVELYLRIPPEEPEPK